MIDPCSDEGAAYMLTAPELAERRVSLSPDEVKELIIREVLRRGVEPERLIGGLYSWDVSEDSPACTVLLQDRERA